MKSSEFLRKLKKKAVDWSDKAGVVTRFGLDQMVMNTLSQFTRKR